MVGSGAGLPVIIFSLVSKGVLTFRFLGDTCNDPEGEPCCPHDACKAGLRGACLLLFSELEWVETRAREQSFPTSGAVLSTPLCGQFQQRPWRAGGDPSLIPGCPFPPWEQKGLPVRDLLRAGATNSGPPTCFIGIQPHPFSMYRLWLLSHYSGQVSC